MHSPRKTRSQTQTEKKDTAHIDTKFGATMASPISPGDKVDNHDEADNHDTDEDADLLVDRSTFTDIPFLALKEINGPAVVSKHICIIFLVLLPLC